MVSAGIYRISLYICASRGGGTLHKSKLKVPKCNTFSFGVCVGEGGSQSRSSNIFDNIHFRASTNIPTFQRPERDSEYHLTVKFGHKFTAQQTCLCIKDSL